MSKQKTVGREYLVKQLQRRGVSRRQAVRILNVFFGEIKRALARGQLVDFPLGFLWRVVRQYGRRPRNRQQYTVAWELDEAGARILYPEARAEVTEQRRRRRPKGSLRSTKKSANGQFNW